MDQIGRFPKFDLNRKLTDKEHKNQLKPFTYNQHDSIRNVDEYLTTIKINSSYLELTDRCFANRGTFGFIGLCFLWLGLFFTALMLDLNPDAIISRASVLMIAAVFAMCYGSAYILLSSELFNLTHNPIRFNRRNRMVYAFLYNKEVVAIPWDDAFFCICEGNHIGGAELDIRGHILDDDRVTVKATFALGHREYSASDLRVYWNFINWYMEKGPEELVGKVKFCLPIADQKESAVWSFNTSLDYLGYLLFPFMIIFWGCRCLATATSKIPVWPDWVEEKCKIDPEDPFVRDASTNPPVHAFSNLMKMQWAAAAAAEDAEAQKARAVVRGISRQEKNDAAKKAKLAAVKNATKKGRATATRKITKRS